MKLGFVKDEEIASSLLSSGPGVPSISLNQFEIDPAVVEGWCPPRPRTSPDPVPLSRVGATLTIAITSPTSVFALEQPEVHNRLQRRARRRMGNGGSRRHPEGPTARPAARSHLAAKAAVAENAAGESALEITSRAMSEMPNTDAMKIKDHRKNKRNDADY